MQIIRRALRIGTVLDAQEAVEASDAQDALETLNTLLAEWHEAGMGLPDYVLNSLTDELATDAADRDAIAYQLWLRLAPEYGKEIAQAVAIESARSLARMRARYFQASHPIPSVYY